MDKGPGQVYLADTDCDKLEARLESEKQGRVNVEITTRDDFLCRFQSEQPPYSPVLALKGVTPLGMVVCEKEISTEDYSSPLSIELKYKYVDSISTVINILPED